MANDDEDEPAVALGEGEPVEGAPLARLSERFMWGIEKSTIDDREGETVIRTPDGPRELGTVLEEVDQPYFATRQEFEDAVRDVIGTGPIPTAGDDSDENAEEDAVDEERAVEESTDDESDDDGDVADDADGDDDESGDDESDENESGE